MKNWSKYKSARKRMIAIMYNPNVAGLVKIDKSVMLCTNKAFDMECDEIVVLNLYSKRKLKPKYLSNSDKVIEAANLNEIEKYLTSSQNNDATCLLVAWGYDPGAMIKDSKMRNLLLGFSGGIKSFGKTCSGHPRHPSRLSDSTELEDFNIKEYYKNIIDKV